MEGLGWAGGNTWKGGGGGKALFDRDGTTEYHPQLSYDVTLKYEALRMFLTSRVGTRDDVMGWDQGRFRGLGSGTSRVRTRDYVTGWDQGPCQRLGPGTMAQVGTSRDDVMSWYQGQCHGLGPGKTRVRIRDDFTIIF